MGCRLQSEWHFDWIVRCLYIFVFLEVCNFICSATIRAASAIKNVQQPDRVVCFALMMVVVQCTPIKSEYIRGICTYFYQTHRNIFVEFEYIFNKLSRWLDLDLQKCFWLQIKPILFLRLLVTRRADQDQTHKRMSIYSTDS